MIAWLLDPAGLTPHGFCLLWQPELIWLYALSDVAIGLSYFTIPAALVVFLRRRTDVQLRPVAWLFAAFILLCGIGHWLNLLTLWVPAYGLEGMVKAATALVSVGTAVALWVLLPQALTVPSPGQLRDANAALAERQHYAAEVDRANANLQQFTYLASHDLKAPLRAVANLAEWIAEDVEEAAGVEVRENLRLMRQRVRRLDTLLDGLLAYSRVGHGKAAVEEVALDRLVAEVTELLAPPAGFSVRTEGKPLVLHSPRAPLAHVLQNLIANAIRHHDRPAGTIVVSARVQGEMVEIRVADDGPGIAPQHQQRIFQIFQTLKSADEGASSGVGLSIVQKTVDGAGGRVWVESAPPARGTVFAFTWPLGA